MHNAAPIDARRQVASAAHESAAKVAVLRDASRRLHVGMTVEQCRQALLEMADDIERRMPVYLPLRAAS